MAKKSKLKTPEWILQGKEKPNKKKSRSFKIRFCPKCGSDNVFVVLGNEEGKGEGEWQCNKCKWKGTNIKEQEMKEEEFVKYLDEKGKEVS